MDLHTFPVGRPAPCRHPSQVLASGRRHVLRKPGPELESKEEQQARVGHIGAAEVPLSGLLLEVSAWMQPPS